jgi:7-cyano-7-deazaguanine synthase
VTKKAVVLLSGGLDSATVLEIAKSQGYEIYALSFSYGQRHQAELAAVQKVLAASPVREHKIATIDLRLFGGSALTADIDVPKDRSTEELTHGIPITYVPARNTIFLSFALGWAEIIGSYDIFIGVNTVDFSGYPDCRADFISAFEATANLATAAGANGRRFHIHTPLIDLSKAEIIATGLALGVDYSLTLSCYDPTPEGLACGRCDACSLRLKGFADNTIEDPASYSSNPKKIAV